jgi:hypothetical protein
MVTDVILTPSGVRLSPNNVRAVHIQANSITSDKIQANSITSDKISANLVLVNNLISSNNYVANESGWILHGNGFAEFGAAAIRGGITAESVSIGDDDYWHANGEFKLGGSTGISSSEDGSVTIGSDVTIDGNISADNITSGSVDSTPGGDKDISFSFGDGKFTINSDGNVFANSGTFTGDISFDGHLDGPSGTIGGWLIDGSNLRSGSGNTILRPDGLIEIGGGLAASGNVDSGSDINASGNITANGIVRANENVIAGGRLRQIDASFVSGAFHNIVRDDGNGEFFLESSKRELKKDIEYYTDGIEKIKLLKPASFRWNEWRYGSADIEEMFLTNKHYGFIAEDVAEVLPNFAQWTTSTNPPSAQMWDNQAITSVSVAAIKELIARIEFLEQRVQDLENGV